MGFNINELSDYQQLPIGVFDSGVGGLTVLKALRELLPDENFMYLGDTARLPYGTKSPDTIIQYAASCAYVLKKRGIKLLVVACNTAASVALPALTDEFYPIPVISVIKPGAQAACAQSKTNHIAVLATEGTVRSHVYRSSIHLINPHAKVDEQSCSLLVSMAEEGWTHGALVEAIIKELLKHLPLDGQKQDMDTHGVLDTLVLGCTHFPVLKEAIQNVVGNKISIIDSAHTTARAVNELLLAHNLKNPNQFGNCHFMATDNIERFKKMASIFLGAELNSIQVELVDV